MPTPKLKPKRKRMPTPKPAPVAPPVLAPCRFDKPPIDRPLVATNPLFVIEPKPTPAPPFIDNAFAPDADAYGEEQRTPTNLGTISNPFQGDVLRARVLFGARERACFCFTSRAENMGSLTTHLECYIDTTARSAPIWLGVLTSGARYKTRAARTLSGDLRGIVNRRYKVINTSAYPGSVATFCSLFPSEARAVGLLTATIEPLATAPDPALTLTSAESIALLAATRFGPVNAAEDDDA